MNGYPWLERVSAQWRSAWIGVEAWQWVGLAILVAASILVGWLAAQGLSYAFRIRRRYQTPEGPRLARSIERSGAWLLAALAFNAGVSFLRLAPEPSRLASQTIWVFELFTLAWLVASIWRAVIAIYQARVSPDRDSGAVLLPFASKIGVLIAWLVALATVLGGLGYNVTGLIAGLGIGGVAVALAAKNTVENFFGSFSVILDHPFVVGDWVKIGPTNGVVEHIGLRTTRIRTFDDSLVTLPNSTLTQTPIENMGLRRKRRFVVQLWIHLDVPLSKILNYVAALKAAAKDLPATVSTDTYVSLFDLTLDGHCVQLATYFDVPDYAAELEGRQQILSHMLRLAVEQDVQLAHRTVLQHPQS